MNNITKITMLSMAVNDMPKAKEFYTEKLGFHIGTEYRQDDAHWWVSVKLPDDSVVITLSTFHGNGTPGTMHGYLLAPDIEATYADLAAKGANPTPISTDLYGPGSGVKWCSVKDPDGNTWQLTEAVATWM